MDNERRPSVVQDRISSQKASLVLQTWVLYFPVATAASVVQALSELVLQGSYHRISHLCSLPRSHQQIVTRGSPPSFAIPARHPSRKTKGSLQCSAAESLLWL